MAKKIIFYLTYKIGLLKFQNILGQRLRKDDNKSCWGTLFEGLRINMVILIKNFKKYREAIQVWFI